MNHGLQLVKIGKEKLCVRKRERTTRDGFLKELLDYRSLWSTVASTGLRRGRDEMALRGHNRRPGGPRSPLARGITITNFIKILCHVVFSILQAV